MNKKIIPIFLVCVLGLAIVPQIAGARIVPECMSPGITVTQPDGTTKTVAACGLCDFFLLITNIYDFIAFKLTPPVAGLMIVFAGALFLISGGSEERVSQAKKIFINVVIGLVFVYASWLIVNSIIQVIGASGNIRGWSKTTWMQFNCN